MKIAWKLTLAYVWRHPGRMVLTSLAMVAAACVVVWVVSGYDALVAQFDDRASETLGRYDLFLVPDATEASFIPPDLVEAITRDDAIAEWEAALQCPAVVRTDAVPGENAGGNDSTGGARTTRGRGQRAGASRRGTRAPVLVGTTAAAPPRELLEGRWINAADPTCPEAAIAKGAAEQFGVARGDEVAFGGARNIRLTIVGIVAEAESPPPTVRKESPTGRPVMSGPATSLGPASSAVYVPLALAQEIAGQPGRVNLVSIKLREGEDLAAFRARWNAQVAEAAPAVLLAGADDLTAAMGEDRMAASTRGQAWAATGMSLLAALFIIFTTLSMGVDERVRQFAVMRAVGLTRGQVAGVIATESLVLALVGWGGGLLAGWGLITIVNGTRPELFQNGASLGTWCIALTGVCAFGGSLMAAVFPAWQATNVEPLEAMAPRRSVRPDMRWSLVVGAAGLALIAVNPFLVYVMPIDDAARYGVYMGIGCTSMAIGFLLLAPLAIAATETLLGPWVARLVGLPPRLVRSQLSSNLWRSLGTTVALSVGLGLFASMMVWGYSMLEPFKPGAWVPDALVAIPVGGLPDEEIDAVRQIEGVVPEQCIPLAVEQPRLAKDYTDSAGGNSVTRQDNVIMIGLDAQTAFGGPDPLVGARFVEGTAEEAIAKLRQGRHCIVPDHFLQATGLRIGDRFAVLPPERPDAPVEYTIAAAVSLPGWHWMTKFSGLRRRSGRSAAMVFADYDDVRRDFDLTRVNFLWMNVDERFGERHLDEVVKAETAKRAAAKREAAEREAAEREVAKNTAPGARPATSRQSTMSEDMPIDAQYAAVTKIGEALRPIAERNPGERQPVNGQGTWDNVAMTFGPAVRVSTPEMVRFRIIGRADGMIWALCKLPLVTLLVTSLGVVNTIAASVRARRWELGVLRALGVTRGALCRMILVEGLLIGLVACAVSLAFGVIAGWCGTGITPYYSFFGGLATPLIVPWPKLALGFAATLALCLTAALWPALATGHTEPLRLLQEGRSAM